MKIFLYLIPLLLVLGCQEQTSENQETSQEDASSDRVWWKEAIVYQIYPRSFKDSDGDGVGDLRGIIQKLDYIQSLGVTAVWLNPIYSSPNDDNGYDISDYRDIMQEFGTMEEFDEMLAGFHERDIKLIMDLVVNHSSDEHEWFQKSRSAKDSPYRDYYHWWEAEQGEPNPRYSFFDVNNDAWEYDSLTDAYYLHYFSEKQPDLNWENPELREEVYEIMRFWLDKGIDGFRMDAFQYISKDTTFPKLPEGYEEDIIQYYGMGPNLHKYIQEMNKEVISQYDVMTVAEGAGSTFEDAMSLVDPARKELNMVYHFEGMDIGNSLDGYDLQDFKRVYTRWDSAFAEKGWVSIFLANHDVPRMVSKFGNDSPEFREASAKMLNTFILSMRGTPYCYFGDELGMTNMGFEKIEDYQDIAARNGYQKVVSEGGDVEAYMAKLRFLSRDNARTPMQWDSGQYAGFSESEPWIPVHPNHEEINVVAQDKDPNSVLNYFRQMTKFRQDYPVMVYGAYELIAPEHEQVYAYTRTLEDQQMLVILNFSEEEVRFKLPPDITLGKLMINNYPKLETEGNIVILKPFQALIHEL